MKPTPRFAGLFVLAILCWWPADFSQASPFSAIVARHSIDLNGNSISTDSYDSSDPTKSTNGYYDSTKYTGDAGDVICNDGLTNTLAVGDARIYGHVHIGPGGGIALGANGAIGDHAWQTTHLGTEPGWSLTDANYAFPDVSFPYQASSPGVLTSTQPADVVSTNYSYTTNGVTSSTFPNPFPPGGVVTNVSYFTVTPWSAVPSPTPPGITTNVFSTNSVTWAPGAVFTNTVIITSISYPAAGTYLGSVTTNHNGGGPITGYTYNKIVAYAYQYYTYRYPEYFYSYSVYGTNTLWQTNHYDNYLHAGASYFLNTLTGSTYVAGADVRLVVANGIDLTQPIGIPKNSAIAIWSGGTSIAVSDGQIISLSTGAGAFILYCAPTVTSVRLYTSGFFTGVIVAPAADFLYYGGGNYPNDFCGALVVNSLTMYGHVNFHLDEALNQVAPRLSAPAYSNANQFQFRVVGISGFRYAVEASTDLVNWVSLLTNTSPFTFLDPDAPNFPQRYYRSVYVP